MSDLAKSAVTHLDNYNDGGITGKKWSANKVQLVLTGQGTATNKILASVLGLTKIERASEFTADGDDHIYVAAPSYDGSFLLLKASATDAPADITDTVRGTVWGT